MLEFFAPCVPPKCSHHSKRIVRVRGFARLADTPDLQQARATLDAVLAPGRPDTPMTGPISLHLTLVWPWLTSDGKRVRASGSRVSHDRKPDADNAAKGIIDALVRLGYFEEDSRIVWLSVRKWRGETPGIGVQMLRWSTV